MLITDKPWYCGGHGLNPPCTRQCRTCARHAVQLGHASACLLPVQPGFVETDVTKLALAWYKAHLPVEECVVKAKACVYRNELCVGRCKNHCAITGEPIVSATGHKDDAEKPQPALVPVEALEAMAIVHTYGAQKYGTDNWRGGMPSRRLYNALQRHLQAWLAGEDLDPVEKGGSGLPHLWHALTTLGMLVWMVKRRPDLDDRWKPNDNNT